MKERRNSHYNYAFNRTFAKMFRSTRSKWKIPLLNKLSNETNYIEKLFSRIKLIWRLVVKCSAFLRNVNIQILFFHFKLTFFTSLVFRRFSSVFPPIGEFLDFIMLNSFFVEFSKWNAYIKLAYRRNKRAKEHEVLNGLRSVSGLRMYFVYCFDEKSTIDVVSRIFSNTFFNSGYIFLFEDWTLSKLFIF